MVAVQKKRIMAQRLIDHSVSQFPNLEKEIEKEDDPLDVTIIYASMDTLAEALIEHCENHRWEEVKAEVISQIGGDVGQIESELTRVEAATADFFLDQVGLEFNSLFFEAQEEPCTRIPSPPFEFDPLIEDLDLK